MTNATHDIDEPYTLHKVKKWAYGISWSLAGGWLAGAIYFGVILHDQSRVAYCLISFAGVLAPGIPVTTLQSWLQTLPSSKK